MAKIKKLKPIRKLMKDLDDIFSKFIRQRDAGICFTCGNTKEPKYQQCGHYISRGVFNTRYDEENCHCQCVACNIFKKGNMDEYAIRLIRFYGKGILEKLHAKKEQSKKFTREELEEKTEHYKKLVKD